MRLGPFISSTVASDISNDTDPAGPIANNAMIKKTQHPESSYQQDSDVDAQVYP